MTANQINYWTLQEHARANRANELLKSDELAEKKRSNVRNELLKLLDYTDNPIALGVYLGSNGLDASKLQNPEILQNISSSTNDVLNRISNTKQGPTTVSIKDLFSGNSLGLGTGVIPKIIGSLFN